MRIHTGDTVVVISGKDKGKTGEVLRLLPRKGRVVVAGINMRTKHVKKTPQNAGQILKYEASIHASNVMLVDAKTKKRSRIGFEIKDGKKKRIAKRSGEVVTAIAIVVPKKDVSKEKKEKDEKKEKKESSKRTKEAGSAKPEKKPFWKGLGFGTDALQEEDTSKAQDGSDHSVPDQGQSTDVRSHARGK